MSLETHKKSQILIHTHTHKEPSCYDATMLMLDEHVYSNLNAVNTVLVLTILFEVNKKLKTIFYCRQITRKQLLLFY